jgi:hypothetical protein
LSAKQEVRRAVSCDYGKGGADALSIAHLVKVAFGLHYTTPLTLHSDDAILNTTMTIRHSARHALSQVAKSFSL